MAIFPVRLFRLPIAGRFYDIRRLEALDDFENCGTKMGNHGTTCSNQAVVCMSDGAFSLAHVTGMANW